MCAISDDLALTAFAYYSAVVLPLTVSDPFIFESLFMVLLLTLFDDIIYTYYYLLLFVILKKIKHF